MDQGASWAHLGYSGIGDVLWPLQTDAGRGGGGSSAGALGGGPPREASTPVGWWSSPPAAGHEARPSSEASEGSWVLEARLVEAAASCADSQHACDENAKASLWLPAASGSPAATAAAAPTLPPIRGGVDAALLISGVLPTLPTSAHALSGSGGGIIASPVALAAGGLAPRRPQPQQLAGARHGDPETAPLLAADNGRGAKPHSGAPSWPAGGAEADRGHRRGGLRARVQACAYVALNVASTCGIVFANKLVLSPFEFAFPVALTLLHALATAAGMEAMCRGGLFPRNPVPLRAVAPVALAYVGSIVTSNWSIQLNTVGFYQLCKVLITPTLLAVEFSWLGKRPGRVALLSTAVLLLGVSIATLFDKQISSNFLGVAVGLSSTLLSALYQVLASKKQGDLGLSATQLLHQSMPAAAVLLAMLVPLVEPLGLPAPGAGGKWGAPGTLLGYECTLLATVAIIVSAVLGLLVSLSAFLVIGATSALTYNIASHAKTVLIILGGVALFGDAAHPAKLLGVVLAMLGIVVYSTRA